MELISDGNGMYRLSALILFLLTISTVCPGWPLQWY